MLTQITQNARGNQWQWQSGPWRSGVRPASGRPDGRLRALRRFDLIGVLSARLRPHMIALPASETTRIWPHAVRVGPTHVRHTDAFAGIFQRDATIHELIAANLATGFELRNSRHRQRLLPLAYVAHNVAKKRAILRFLPRKTHVFCSGNSQFATTRLHSRNCVTKATYGLFYSVKKRCVSSTAAQHRLDGRQAVVG
jgi:hypothetical protein